LSEGLLGAVAGVPAEPEVPASQQATGSLLFPYECVTQDGRLVPLSMSQVYSDTVWRDLLGSTEMVGQMRAAGIVPILARLVFATSEATFAPGTRFSASGRYALAHHAGASNEIERILLRMWGQARGRPGHAFAPAAPGAPLVAAGETYAEHVFTRLFVPPAERRVTRLPGVEEPGPRVEALAPDAPFLLPPGATPIDEDFSPDAVPVVMSLGHTDSNQHVNSLVYPRLFEEAALRRLAARGREVRVLPRLVDCVYRKPCFAGDAMRFWLRLVERGPRVTALGLLLREGETPATGKPHVFVRLDLSP
jgi:acyl-CoA thioesterase FadM